MRDRSGNQSWLAPTGATGELSQVAGGTSLSGTQDGSSGSAARQGKMEEGPQGPAQPAGPVLTWAEGFSFAPSGATTQKLGNRSSEHRSNRHCQYHREKPMNRRDFIVGTGAGLGAVWPGSKTWTESGVTAGTAGIFIGDQAKTTSEHSYPAE